jgi:tRNA pseudouridine38-40 synthase
LLVFEIVSQAFLYHMVRRLVSFQVEIGQGRRPVSQLVEHLKTPPGELVQGLAPAQGLVLVEVGYGTDESGQDRPGSQDNKEKND